MDNGFIQKDDTEFTVSLAGIPIGVSAVHKTTKKYCMEYLTDEEPVCSVKMTQDIIDNERERAEEGTNYSDRYIETIALYRELAKPLLEHDAVIFHGSAVAVDGKAYLFTAPSGTGKTTHSRLWTDNIPGAYILNGDKPLLKITDDGVFVCGTPWRGKENYGINEILPLEAICVIEQAEDNSIKQIDYKEVVVDLIKQTNRPDNPELLLKTLSLLGKMGGVRFYRLKCNMDPEAAWVSYSEMKK